MVLEPAAPEADAAEARGLAVLRGTLEEMPVSGTDEPLLGTFDVVLLCQTVDHLLDVSGSLRKLRGMLKPGGLLFMDFVHDGPLKIDHPYYLDWGTALLFMKQAGFQPIRTTPDVDGLHVNFVCQ